MKPVDTSERRAALNVALGFALLLPSAPELKLIHGWLDTWRGIGDVVVGMARQDYDLQLTRYDGRAWRATFYTSGMEHSATSAIGSAWETTPWRAVQRAAWETLDAGDAAPPGGDAGSRRAAASPGRFRA